MTLDGGCDVYEISRSFSSFLILPSATCAKLGESNFCATIRHIYLLLYQYIPDQISRTHYFELCRRRLKYIARKKEKPEWCLLSRLPVELTRIIDCICAAEVRQTWRAKYITSQHIYTKPRLSGYVYKLISKRGS